MPMVEPRKRSRRAIPNDSPATGRDPIQIALRVFQQSASNLQQAIVAAGKDKELGVASAYVPAAHGTVLVLTGIMYCGQCHWYTAGDHCEHCAHPPLPDAP